MTGERIQHLETPYFQPPNSGPRCSTPRSARLRQRRFDMRYQAPRGAPMMTCHHRLADQLRRSVGLLASHAAAALCYAPLP